MGKGEETIFFVLNDRNYVEFLNVNFKIAKSNIHSNSVVFHFIVYFEIVYFSELYVVVYLDMQYLFFSIQ